MNDTSNISTKYIMRSFYHQTIKWLTLSFFTLRYRFFKGDTLKKIPSISDILDNNLLVSLLHTGF